MHRTTISITEFKSLVQENFVSIGIICAKYTSKLSRDIYFFKFKRNRCTFYLLPLIHVTVVVVVSAVDLS